MSVANVKFQVKPKKKLKNILFNIERNGGFFSGINPIKLTSETTDFGCMCLDTVQRLMRV